MNALVPQCFTQFRQHVRETPVGMKPGAKPELAGDFGHRQVVLEAQLDQQSIGRPEPGHAYAEGSIEICDGYAVGRVRVVPVNQRIEFDRGTDQIYQAAPRCQLGILATAGRALPAASVAMTVMIEADALCDDDEPRGELASSIGYEGSQTPVIVPAKFLEDSRVPVHNGVVIAAK